MSPRSTQNGGVLHPDAPISLRIGAKVVSQRFLPCLAGLVEQQVAALTVWRLTSRRCTRSPTRATSLRKQVFCLRTGRCLDAPGTALPVFDVRIRDGVTRPSIPGNTDEMAVGA